MKSKIDKGQFDGKGVSTGKNVSFGTVPYPKKVLKERGGEIR